MMVVLISSTLADEPPPDPKIAILKGFGFFVVYSACLVVNAIVCRMCGTVEVMMFYSGGKVYVAGAMVAPHRFQPLYLSMSSESIQSI